MKTRLDFISNSSSCSFVVACNEKCLDDVVKDLSKSCSDNKSQYHNKGLAKRNKTILDFCISTFQLLFLGKLLVSAKKQKYDLDTCKRIWSSEESHLANGSSNDVSALASREWQHYKDILMKIKNNEYVAEWEKDEYGMDEYDPLTDTAVHYDKTYASGIVVSNHVMEYDFNRMHYSQDTEDDIRNRSAKIVKFAKAHGSFSSPRIIESLDTYRITKDTIDNTRNLIHCGHDVKLEKWQDLDKLEARIENGDAIFYVRIANSGDGYGDFYIYCEDNAAGINGISGIEVLESECG